MASKQARLYEPPVAGPVDRNRWSDRHLCAVQRPGSLFEQALVDRLRGWLLYADAHQTIYRSNIGDEDVLRYCWVQIGEGLRGVLTGDHGRLDGGTVHRLLCQTLTEAGLGLEDSI